MLLQRLSNLGFVCNLSRFHIDCLPHEVKSERNLARVFCLLNDTILGISSGLENIYIIFS